MCSGVRHIGISDDSIVFAYRKRVIHGFPRGRCTSTITHRNLRKFNLQSFRNDTASHDWDHIHNLSNPNDIWSEWKNSFLEIVDKHAPLRKLRVRGRSSRWIASELKKQMHEKDILKIKAIKSNDPAVWAQFKEQRNIVNKAVKQAKQSYYQTSFSDHKGDYRKAWQINELTSHKSGKSSVKELMVNGQSVTNPTELEDEFNHHFATIGIKLASEIPESGSTSYHNHLTGTNKRFAFHPTTPNQVLSLLTTLDKSKAAGLDDTDLPSLLGNALI